MKTKTLTGIVAGLLVGALAFGSVSPAFAQEDSSFSTSQDTTQTGEIKQSDLFSATRYEAMGDTEQSEQEKVAYYKLALNTILYYGEYEEGQVERLCRKLSTTTDNILYRLLIGDIKENINDYSEDFNELSCKNGSFYAPWGTTYPFIVLPRLLQDDELKNIPPWAIHDHGGREIKLIKGMYTPLEELADYFIEPNIETEVTN